MELVRPDGVAIWWEQEDDGVPVMLVPGRGDASDLYPRRLTDRLIAGGLRPIRYDPRDTGRSGDGGDEYTQSWMVDDAVAVLAAAAGADVAAHWVGISMGGLQLVDLASRLPHLVRSLTFVSAMSPDPDAGFGELFFADPPADPVEALAMAMGQVSDADRAWVADEVERAERRAPARPDAAERHMAASFRLGWPTMDDLRRVTAPTHVLHGSQDRTLPVAHAEALVGGIAGAQLTVREGMGHIPRPADWDAVAGAVLDQAVSTQ